MPQDDGGRILVEQRGHLLLMGIDRVAKRNAFSLEMYAQLSRAYGRLQQDPELRVGVLYALGPHFTGGLDLAEFAPVFASGRDMHPEGGLDPMRLTGPTLDKPVVCALQGICYTVGLELMLATEVRVAAEDTRFGQIEVRRGIYPVGGATVRFVREAGWGNAMRWLLSGEEFDAREAWRMGFVQEVVPVGQQLERAIAIAEGIARQAPLGVYQSLISARVTFEEGPRAAIERLMPDLVPIMQSEDAQEGLMSFLERRPAEFKGR
jgi:enoyl-CoA hydratase/carnithine racemase